MTAQTREFPTMLAMVSIDIAVVIAKLAGSDMTVECLCVNHMTWMNKNIEEQKNNIFT